MQRVRRFQSESSCNFSSMRVTQCDDMRASTISGTMSSNPECGSHLRRSRALLALATVGPVSILHERGSESHDHANCGPRARTPLTQLPHAAQSRCRSRNRPAYPVATCATSRRHNPAHPQSRAASRLPSMSLPLVRGTALFVERDRIDETELGAGGAIGDLLGQEAHAT